MNFEHFLTNLRTKNNIKTSTEHYESLGGQSKLDISLRRFQQIESGKHPPSLDLLSRIFSTLEPADKKTAVISFFSSSVDFGKQKNNPLLDYLNSYLNPALEETKESIWDDKSRRYMNYTEEQLRFLMSDDEVLKFHRKLLLYGPEDSKHVTIPQDRLKKLEDLELVEVSNNYIKASRSLFRLPNFENSGPKTVKAANEFIFKVADVFVSKEGSNDQQIGYGFISVPPWAAELILDQMRSLKRWALSFTDDSTRTDLVPVLFMIIGKKLAKKDFT